VSISTIRTHICNIYNKLHVNVQGRGRSQGAEPVQNRFFFQESIMFPSPLFLRQNTAGRPHAMRLLCQETAENPLLTE